MSVRLLEIVLPPGQADRLADLLREEPLLGCWAHEAADGQHIARILVSTEQTEHVTDLLRQAFEGMEGFRVVLLKVEAVIPSAGDEAQKVEAASGNGDGTSLPRVSREELYEDVKEAAQVTPIYVVTVALSTIVAAAGLMRGDIAVLIGAMVIAPLLGPNVALTLAATLGDGRLAAHAAKAIGVGVGSVLLLSVLIGAALGVDPEIPELAARTRVGLSDVAIALAAGSAGSLAYTTGLPAAVIGVMVAVALLPPLVATGLLAGSGYGRPALGALGLVVVNVTCLNLAAVGTFLAQKVRPRTWWEAEKAKRATRIAVVSWLAMLLVLVAAILVIGSRA